MPFRYTFAYLCILPLLSSLLTLPLLPLSPLSFFLSFFVSSSPIRFLLCLICLFVRLSLFFCATFLSACHLFPGYIYRIKFMGNPGKLKSPEIETFLDGKRVALVASQVIYICINLWTTNTFLSDVASHHSVFCLNTPNFSKLRSTECHHALDF